MTFINSTLWTLCVEAVLLCSPWWCFVIMTGFRIVGVFILENIDWYLAWMSVYHSAQSWWNEQPNWKINSTFQKDTGIAIIFILFFFPHFEQETVQSVICWIQQYYFLLYIKLESRFISGSYCIITMYFQTGAGSETSFKLPFYPVIK